MRSAYASDWLNRVCTVEFAANSDGLRVRNLIFPIAVPITDLKFSLQSFRSPKIDKIFSYKTDVRNITSYNAD